MNLNELFEKQRQLDERIIKEHNLQGQDLSYKKAVALLTELFECVNEARFFKFWSKDQKARTKGPRKMMPEHFGGTGEWYTSNPLLEEYVDTLHFTLSIANDIGYTEHEYDDPGDYDLSNTVLGLAQLISTLPYVHKNNKKKNMELIFNYLIKLGYNFDFNEEIVKEAYYKKNETNYKRLEIGY